eukprot:8710553-Pyramimonas_sp.AAC.1
MSAQNIQANHAQVCIPHTEWTPRPKTRKDSGSSSRKGKATKKDVMNKQLIVVEHAATNGRSQRASFRKDVQSPRFHPMA